MTAGKHKAKNNILSTASPGTQSQPTDEINAGVSFGGSVWGYFVLLRQA